jgi:hypothetical protein
MTSRELDLRVRIPSGVTPMVLLHSLFISARTRALLGPVLTLLALVVAGAAGTKW